VLKQPAGRLGQPGDEDSGHRAKCPVQILVNNAGGSRRFGLDTGDDEWDEALTLNFTRHRQLTTYLLPAMIEGGWGRIMSEQIERNYSPEYRAWQSGQEIPVGEYGQPGDIAHLVCFIASPLARYITGAVIPVDGGLRRYQF
jgi:3-oxoacyl-[acyl-carrier protein] reductase